MIRVRTGLLAVGVIVVVGMLAPVVANATETAPGPGPNQTTNLDDSNTAGLTRVKLDLGSGIAASGPNGTTALGPTTVPGTSTCRSYHIYSWKNAQYVAEEQGYTGTGKNMLRARTGEGARGGWERFGLCTYDGYDIFIKASSGYLVTAEYGYTGANYGMLRGRGDWPNIWEVFQVWSDNGRYYLRNTHTGRYVSVRVDLTGSSANMVRASASTIGPWEQLDLRPVN